MLDSKLASLRTIHGIMLSGQVLFIAVCWFLGIEPSVTDPETLRIMLTTMAVVYFLALLGGRFVFRMMIQKAIFSPGTDNDPEKKYAVYHSAFLTRWGLLEMASFIGSIFFLLSGEKFFLLFSGLLAIVFLADRPTIARAKRELRL